MTDYDQLLLFSPDDFPLYIYFCFSGTPVHKTARLIWMTYVLSSKAQTYKRIIYILTLKME